MEEAAHLGPTDRALVGLHADDLATVDAQAHVAAGQDHRVLVCCVAHNALLLGVVSQVSCIVVDSINVVQVHDLVIIEELLLQ